jgi:hypothetical protein
VQVELGHNTEAKLRGNAGGIHSLVL